MWVHVLITLLLFAGACGGAGDVRGVRPHVVASLYPLAFVAGEVGRNVVELDNLTPPRAEPHDLELTAGQVRALLDADLIIYIGQGFQPSVEEALAEAETSAIDVLDGQQDALEPPEHQDDLGQGTDEHERATPVDPHVWLDPERLGAVAATVASRLAELDRENATKYRANARDLQSRLGALDAEFRHGLARCERTTLVTSHAAFGYLADAYGLEEIGIAGIDPEAEASPRRLAEIADFVHENDVKTIFFEVLVSPQTAETLADEVGIETARLDPLESAPEDGDYFTAMRANLDALRKGLGCK